MIRPIRRNTSADSDKILCMTWMRGLGGFNAQEIEEIQRRQAERLRDGVPEVRRKSSMTDADWRKFSAALREFLES
jgi:hypothetical protein